VVAADENMAARWISAVPHPAQMIGQARVVARGWITPGAGLSRDPPGKAMVPAAHRASPVRIDPMHKNGTQGPPAGSALHRNLP